ncbi:MAG: RNA polymerase sigma factor [Steroidobacteraceae bacterium]
MGVEAQLVDFKKESSPVGGDGLSRGRRGDTAAFEAIYREHVAVVHGLCLRMTGQPHTAEDCTQETFVRAWRALDRFEGRSALRSWLHRIAVNVVLERRRRPMYAVEVPVADFSELDEPWQLDTPVEARELERQIADLPDGLRSVLVLSGIYGYSHAETASMLGIAVGTCKAQLHRGRALLRERLQDREDMT